MDLADALIGTDLRVTQPRRLVWEVLSQEHGHHLTAAEIAERVHQLDPSVNVSSVYRTLASFAEVHLVRESKLGDDDVSHWETAHADHVIHLVCARCGDVMHHDSKLVNKLKAEVLTQHDFVASHVEVMIKGSCKSCSV